MAAPSGGPDRTDLSSEGGDEESDWTAGLSASSADGWEDEGSVRMFLEITGVTEEYLDFVSVVSHVARHITRLPDESLTAKVTPTSPDS